MTRQNKYPENRGAVSWNKKHYWVVNILLKIVMRLKCYKKIKRD